MSFFDLPGRTGSVVGYSNSFVMDGHPSYDVLRIGTVRLSGIDVLYQIF